MAALALFGLFTSLPHPKDNLKKKKPRCRSLFFTRHVRRLEVSLFLSVPLFSGAHISWVVLLNPLFKAASKGRQGPDRMVCGYCHTRLSCSFGASSRCGNAWTQAGSIRSVHLTPLRSGFWEAYERKPARSEIATLLLSEKNEVFSGIPPLNDHWRISAVSHNFLETLPYFFSRNSFLCSSEKPLLIEVPVLGGEYVIPGSVGVGTWL